MVQPILSFAPLTGLAWAPHLVLGHSLGTSAALWANAVPLLAQSFQVTSWELPGHGTSPAAVSPFTIGELADQVIDHLHKDGVDTFCYAGVSIGATVGIDLALRYPGQLTAAAIMSAGSEVDSPAAWAERAATVRAKGTTSLVAGSQQRWFARTTRDRHSDRIEQLLGALADTDDESYALACEALADYDATAQLAEVTPPVLALYGQHDQLVPEQRSAQLAAGVRHGSLQRIPNAAHAGPFEQPEIVARQLLTFFSTALRPPTDIGATVPARNRRAGDVM